ncbi:MAG: phosphodiesterase [Nitrospirales bacterium]|nr:MAG: phosphodiesterase [Nitrospirales bacterium]
MFLVGVYQSWWKSPFFRHNRLLKTQKDVDVLLKSDIKEVMIDPSRGLDVHEETEKPSSTLPSSAQTPIGDVLQDEEVCSASSVPSPQDVSIQIKHDAVTAIERVFEGVKTGAVIDHPTLRHTMQALVKQVFSQEQVMAELYVLENLHAFDKTLYDHVVDVAILSIMVGLQLGVNERDLEVLALGGLLHDVGHVRIPRNVLKRKHELGEHERVIFERHVGRGLAILEQCPSISSEVQRVVAEHHERQDGSGYPFQRAHREISPLSDIVGFIDQLDACVSPWGPPPGLPMALAVRQLYMYAKEGQLRVEPVAALIRCLGVYPLGSLVRLSTGEQAVVVKTNPLERLKPTVKLISDQNGRVYDSPIIENLAASNTSTPQRMIEDILNPANLHIDVQQYVSHDPRHESHV